MQSLYTYYYLNVRLTDSRAPALFEFVMFPNCNASKTRKIGDWMLNLETGSGRSGKMNCLKVSVRWRGWFHQRCHVFYVKFGKNSIYFLHVLHWHSANLYHFLPSQSHTWFSVLVLHQHRCGGSFYQDEITHCSNLQCNSKFIILLTQKLSTLVYSPSLDLLFELKMIIYWIELCRSS